MVASSYDIISIPSDNFSPEIQINPEFIILHCIGLPFQDVIEGLTKPISLGTKGLGVSAHYFIPQLSGAELINQGLLSKEIALSYPKKIPVIQFVPETAKAWHAGRRSYWGALENMNQYSIGIEFHAPGYGAQRDDLFHFTPYTQAQLDTGVQLLWDIINRWKINPKNLLAHSDIVPYIPPDPKNNEMGARIKTDPGPLFPWDFLNTKGLGWLPSMEKSFELNIEGSPEDFVRMKLRQLGYYIPEMGSWGLQERYVVNAFRMHYLAHSCPEIIDPKAPNFGIIDSKLLSALL